MRFQLPKSMLAISALGPSRRQFDGRFQTSATLAISDAGSAAGCVRYDGHCVGAPISFSPATSMASSTSVLCDGGVGDRGYRSMMLLTKA
jgi:hypothetical protein